MPSSKGSSQPRDRACDSYDSRARQADSLLLSHWFNLGSQWSLSTGRPSRLMLVSLEGSGSQGGRHGRRRGGAGILEKARSAVDPQGHPRAAPAHPARPQWAGGVQGACSREGTWNLEPQQTSPWRREPWRVLGAKSPTAWVQRPAREERGVTPGWAARVPANLLHVVQRHEHLWQLPPRLLWSDVNRGESVPSPGQAGQSSAQGPETRLPPCEETLARPEHQGQMRTEQPRHHPGLFPSSPRRAEAAVKVVQVHAGK